MEWCMLIQSGDGEALEYRGAELWRFIRSPGAHWQPLSRTFKWLLGEGAGDNALQPPLPACSYCVCVCVCVTECECSLYVYLKTGKRGLRGHSEANEQSSIQREIERESSARTQNQEPSIPVSLINLPSNVEIPSNQTLFRHLQHFSQNHMFIHYSLENGNKI